MINHPLRCIYVHIPKTAGNSINRVFGVGWQDHKDLARYAAELPAEQFASYYKFTIVRNPWERIFSDYNYQRKKSRARASKLYLYKQEGARRSFREWVEAALSEPYRYPATSWGGDVSPGIHRLSPQLDWITLQGRPSVDFVARIENLQADFEHVCGALRLPPVRLPHRNRRLHAHYSWYYDEETRERVAAYYARDIEAFGYQFEISPTQAILRHSTWLAASLLVGWRFQASLLSHRLR